MNCDGDSLARVMSIRRAAELSGRSPSTLRAAARRGSLGARRVGRDWVTTEEALATYLGIRARRRPAVGVFRRPETTQVG